MHIADTSFLIRSIEFQKFEEVNSELSIKITSEIQDELEQKDADTVRGDLERIENLVENEAIGEIEIIKKSAAEREISNVVETLATDKYSIGDDYQSKIDALDLPQNLEKGELTASIFSKEENERLLIDDFNAYNELFTHLNGNLSCLCEIIISYSEPDSVEHQKIVSVIEELFIPYGDMDVSIRAPIRKKIENFVDRKFKVLS